MCKKILNMQILQVRSSNPACMYAGIDTVGIYIENPNTILPMASYCRAMHQDVLLSAHEWAAETGNVRTSSQCLSTVRSPVFLWCSP